MKPPGVQLMFLAQIAVLRMEDADRNQVLLPVARNSPVANSKNEGGLKHMRKFIIRIAAAARIASALVVLAGSWMSAEGRDFKPGACTSRHAACVDRCLTRVCATCSLTPCIERTCDKQYDNCVKAEGKDNRPQGSTGPKGGGVAKDPTPPPKSTGTRPLPDNKWHGPKSPLKPLGGAIFNQTPAPSSSGSQPILKSSGGGQR